MSTDTLEQLIRARLMLDPVMGEEEDGSDDEVDLNWEWCKKDKLVRAHELQLAHLNGKSSFSWSFARPEAATPSRPLQSLRPIHIRNLQVGSHHKRRVLYGELCVEPCQMVSVQTILVDEVGHAAKLSVYNALPHQHHAQKMGTLFSKGLKVAIKEPYFKVAMDGSLMIRVDNPADFVRNPKVRGEGLDSRNIGASTFSVSSSSPPLASSPSPDQPRALLDAHDLRVQGNQAFAAKDWKIAIQLYSDALKILLQHKDTSSLSPSALSVSQVTKELVLGLSNRAEARLRLKHFEAAESDARKALLLQKNHVKSFFRRGRALDGLHQYKEAALCFKEALLQMNSGENGMSIKELRSALEATEICERQARTGQYDLLKMWREVEQGMKPLCGEYIGPVEIGPARERSLGRGLLVTRDVKPGDLLLVSKAVAHAEVDRSSLIGSLSQAEISKACTGSKSLSPVSNIYHDDLALQIIDRALTSKRFQDQVNTLSSTDASCVQNNVPGMDLFVPKPLSTELKDVFAVEDKGLSTESLDMENIGMVTRNNAFEIAGEMCATLWLLPSFINHSCLPNACWVKVGKEALFVRAVRHLTKGQEVLISYLDNPALPLPLRASFLQLCRGFECRCERCSFEKAMEPFTRPLELKVALQPAATTGALEVVKHLEWAFNNVTAFVDEKKKHWLSTSYSASYALVLGNGNAQTLNDIHPLETIVRAVQETLGGSEDVLTVIRQRVNLEECSPYVREIVAKMYVCLYGIQAPATLKKIVALRHSMVEKAA